MKVKIRRKDTTIPLPQYSTRESAAFDIASYETVVIQPKELRLVRTGLFFSCPHGHFLAIFSRSSTPKKKGLLQPHSVGVLDPDYSGPDDELLLQVYNFTDKPVEISKGDRIAQGIFLPFEHVQWEEVDVLGTTNRGGFGSTGT